MGKYSFLISLLVLWFFCQCDSRHSNDDNGSDYPSKETFAAIDSCMGLMTSNPQKTHRMLDSLKNARLMTQQRCDYFHAMVVFSGERRLDSALVICNRLLDGGKFGDDRFLEEEICVLASNITMVSLRPVETLKYAKRGIEICHGDERMRGDEAELMARVGTAEMELGRMQQARDTYARAYNLLKKNTSFGDFVALISLQKQQAGLYSVTKEYDRVIDVCHDILGQVERFANDPSFIERRPETMQQAGLATRDFAEFYKPQMYVRIARAYRKKIESGQSKNIAADKDSARLYVDRWSQTEDAKSPESMTEMIHELYFTGRKADFAEAKTMAEKVYSADSMVNEYVEYLRLLAKDAAQNNDLRTSNAYLQRAMTVGDSVHSQEMMRELSQQMALTMVQEEQLARQDAENQLARHRTVIILESIMLVAMLIAGLVIYALVRRRRKDKEIIEMTQHDLSESKEEIKTLVHQLEDTKNEKNVNNAQSLYERIEQAMSEQSLYLNPELDIKMLAEAVVSSRSLVSQSINSVTGKNFRQWLAEYRLGLMVQMMKENPEAPIDALLMKCGYKDQSTFRRQFKTTYGITAGEFKRRGGNIERIMESDEQH